LVHVLYVVGETVLGSFEPKATLKLRIWWPSATITTAYY